MAGWLEGVEVRRGLKRGEKGMAGRGECAPARQGKRQRARGKKTRRGLSSGAFAAGQEAVRWWYRALACGKRRAGARKGFARRGDWNVEMSGGANGAMRDSSRTCSGSAGNGVRPVFVSDSSGVWAGICKAWGSFDPMWLGRGAEQRATPLPHRLDELTGLSLGAVASQQSRLAFHPARSV